MKKKVLIIDDDISIIKILTKILEFENFEIYSQHKFESLEEIHSKYHEISFDLMIVDYMLDSFNGLDLLQMMRSGVNSEAPAILITAYVLSPDVSASLLENNIKFVRKPFNRNDLLKNVREALSANEAEFEDFY